MEQEIVKHYSNGEITVVWKPALCIHSKKCWNNETGLPSVFNPRIRPWVNMDGSDSEHIAQQVEQCPSKALSYVREAAAEGPDLSAANQPASVTEVQVLPDGPLLVTGNLRITGRDGQVCDKTSVTAFCRCGQSANKPYCDGSHGPANFKG